MSIDKHEANHDAAPERSEHLLTGIFTPGEKTQFTPVDQYNAFELLQRNDRIVAEAQAHATRLAAAAVTTLKGMPAEFHTAFFDGISCYTSADDHIYNSVRQQWNGGDVHSA
jgi:hypothetical protein